MSLLFVCCLSKTDRENCIRITNEECDFISIDNRENARVSDSTGIRATHRQLVTQLHHLTSETGRLVHWQGEVDRCLVEL